MRWKHCFSKYHVKNITTTSITIENGTKREDNFEDDYVAQSIGIFGRWQFINVALASIARLISCWNAMCIIFLAPVTDFVCETFSDNATFEVNNNTCYDNCVKYKFENHLFEETFVSEFGMICEDAWKASFTQTAMMFGIMCGAFFYGWLSDRFGRSKALAASCINSVIFMFLLPLCKTFWILATLRFLSGFGSGGTYSMTAVYSSELVGTKIAHTVLAVTVPAMAGTSLLILAVSAYFMTSWRDFTLVYSGLSLVVSLVIVFLPESPRWLIAKDKIDEAITLMTRAVKFNKMDDANIKENVIKHAEKIKQMQSKKLHLTYIDLFRTKKLAILTIASCILWINAGFSYFGLIQYISQFGTDIYSVVCLLGVVHIIALISGMTILRFCGRKPSCIGTCIVIGIITLALLFTPKRSTEGVVLGSLGLTSVVVIYSVNYVYAVELYPTPMRSMGLGLCSVGSYLAAMAAPFVINMLTPIVVSFTFSAVSFGAALCCLLLPETKGKTLKDTVDEN